MLIEFDKFKRMFTGIELTETLAIVPIHPEKTSLYYRPLFHQWNTIQSGLHTFVTLKFHDTRGTPFKHLTLSLVLKYRKNTLS